MRWPALSAGYYAVKDWDGPVYAKAGLMPRWSRDGRFVAFDSAHIWGTGSQMYVAGVQQMKVGWPAVAAPPAKDPPARWARNSPQWISAAHVAKEKQCFLAETLLPFAQQIETASNSFAQLQMLVFKRGF